MGRPRRTHRQIGVKRHEMFLLRIEEATGYVFLSDAWVVSTGNSLAQDWAVVAKFIDSAVMKGSRFAEHVIPLMGLYAGEKASPPWFLPNEREYKAAIAQSS